jgi:adenine-specific DNA-methyltransferase
MQRTRVVKPDSSNIRAWGPNREKLFRSLLESIEDVKPDRTEQDILFEILLKFCLKQTVPIEQKSIAGKAAHKIGAGSQFVCLAPKIGREAVEPLAHGLAAWPRQTSPRSSSSMGWST